MPSKIHKIDCGNTRRMSFGKIKDVLEIPYLVEIQKNSFQTFIETGIKEVLEDFSPMTDFSNRLELHFLDHRFDGQPKYNLGECKDRDATYAIPLKVKVRLVNKETGEIIENEVFMGDFPLMTDSGSFVINGAERVVVSQLVRSPSVYCEKIQDKNGNAHYYEIVDTNMYNALTTFDAEEFGVLMSALGGLKNFLTLATTGANPFFAASNFARDIPTSLFNGDIPIWEYPFELGLAMIDVVTGELKNVPMSKRRKAVQRITGTDNDTIVSDLAEWGKARKGLKLVRGKKYYQAQYKKLNPALATIGITADMLANVPTAVMTFNRIIEASPRQAQANRQLRGGSIFSTEEQRKAKEQKIFGAELSEYDKMVMAAHQYHDSSVFFMKGGYGKVARMLYKAIPFLRAALEGIDKFGRAMLVEPNKVQRYINAAVMITAVKLFLGALSRDDEDDDMITAYYRDNNYIIKIGDHEWVKIPIAREVGWAFGVLPDKIWQGVRTGDWGEAGKELLDSFLLNFNIPYEVIGTQVIDTIGNKTWWGGEIAGVEFDTERGVAEDENLPWEKRKEAYSKIKDETTSEFAVKLSAIIRALPFAAGLGMLNSPKGAQAAFDQLTGVIGDLIIPATTKGGSYDPRSLLIKRFTFDPYQNNQTVNDFYSLKGANSYELKMLKDADGELSDKDYDVKVMESIYNAIASGGTKSEFFDGEVPSMSDIRKQIKGISYDEKLSADEKKEKIAALREDYDALGRIGLEMKVDGEAPNNAWFIRGRQANVDKYLDWANKIYAKHILLNDDLNIKGFLSEKSELKDQVDAARDLLGEDDELQGQDYKDNKILNMLDAVVSGGIDEPKEDGQTGMLLEVGIHEAPAIKDIKKDIGKVINEKSLDYKTRKAKFAELKEDEKALEIIGERLKNGETPSANWFSGMGKSGDYMKWANSYYTKYLVKPGDKQLSLADVPMTSPYYVSQNILDAKAQYKKYDDIIKDIPWDEPIPDDIEELRKRIGRMKDTGVKDSFYIGMGTNNVLRNMFTDYFNKGNIGNSDFDDRMYDLNMKDEVIGTAMNIIEDEGRYPVRSDYATAAEWEYAQNAVRGYQYTNDKKWMHIPTFDQEDSHEEKIRQYNEYGIYFWR
ncbi:MAG: hypothetical protein LBJ91_01830 [Clostridiales Family XIII bacterium]|jgi:hypothetical protein|nr:hypothetical protein [Clostridiales Family XIII bacterium]